LVVRPITVALHDLTSLKGEFTVLITPIAGEPGTRTAPSRTILRDEFGLITNNGRVGRREGLKILAKKYGLGVNELYRMLQEPD
jgi:hypothetical protein